jgi:hypothetical protein
MFFIYMSIKIHGDNNTYKYHYIPKQLQVVNNIKHYKKTEKYKTCIDDLKDDVVVVFAQ